MVYSNIFLLTPPSVTTIIDKNTKKTRYNLSFATLALPCFNELYDSFYLKGKKIVPKNIEKYLTPIRLSYWIMVDEVLHRKWFKITY